MSNDHSKVPEGLLPATPGDHGIPAELGHYYVARGRRLQARAVRDTVLGVMRAIGRGLHTLLETYRRRRDTLRSERELRRLDPRLLADIGIEGHQIPAIVRGLDRRHGTADAGSAPAAAEVHALPMRDARSDPSYERAA